MGGLAKSCRQFRRIEDVLVHRSAVPLTAPTDRLSGLRIRPLNSTRRYATTPNTAQKEVLVAEESALVQKAKKKRKPAARKSLAKVAMEAQRSQEKEILTNANDLPEIPSLEKVI